MTESANLEAIVRDALADADIVEVITKDDINRDGEPIVRITVVYRGEEQLDARRMSSTLSRLWDALVSDRDSASPVVSFVTSSDYEGAVAA